MTARPLDKDGIDSSPKWCRECGAFWHTQGLEDCALCYLQSFIYVLEAQASQAFPRLRVEALRIFHHTRLCLNNLFSQDELIVGAVYTALLHIEGAFYPLEKILPACMGADLRIRDTKLIPLALVMQTLTLNQAQMSLKHSPLHPLNYRLILLNEVMEDLALAQPVREATLAIFQDTEPTLRELVNTGALIGGAVYLAIRSTTHDVPEPQHLVQVCGKVGLWVTSNRILTVAVLMRHLTGRQIKLLIPKDYVSSLCAKIKRHIQVNALAMWSETAEQERELHQTVFWLLEGIPRSVQRQCGCVNVVCLAIVEASRRLARSQQIQPLSLGIVADATGQRLYRLKHHQKRVLPLLRNWRKEKGETDQIKKLKDKKELTGETDR